MREKKSGGGEPPDIGYRVYSLTPKPNLEELSRESETLKLQLSSPRSSILDTLVNMLCATCKPLDTPIECVIENALYRADDEIYVVGRVSEDDLIPFRSLKINLDGWAEFSLKDFLNLGFHDKENLNVVY